LIVEKDWFRCRSLSSVAKAMLPRAEEMRRQGLSWAVISRELEVSESALYVWRKIGRRDHTRSCHLRNAESSRR